MKWLRSPMALGIGILLGILIGLFIKPLIPFLSPFSEFYLALLQMCVLPMVACTVCINIGSIFSGKLRGFLRSWVASTVTVLVLSSLIGMTTAFLMRGYITPNDEVKVLFAQMQNGESQSTLELFTRLEFYGVKESLGEPDHQATLVDFLLRVVPTNIFTALANGQTIQVILFFCVLGVMLTKIQKERSLSILNALEGVYSALCEFVNRLMTLLPLAMCAMLAVQFASEEMQGMAGPLFKLILVILIALFCIIMVSFFIIRRTTGCTHIQHWRAVKRTLLIAFGTRSCLASIPVALEDCPENLALDRTRTNAILPIGITMCQSGVIVCGVVMAVFASTIYDVKVTITLLVILLVGSIFFSISIIGVPGMIAASMIGMVLEPLGIPSDVIIIVFLAIMPIIDPFSVFAGIYSNFAVAGVVARKGNGSEDKRDENRKKIVTSPT